MVEWFDNYLSLVFCSLVGSHILPLYMLPNGLKDYWISEYDQLWYQSLPYNISNCEGNIKYLLKSPYSRITELYKIVMTSISALHKYLLFINYVHSLWHIHKFYSSSLVPAILSIHYAIKVLPLITPDPQTSSLSSLLNPN